MNLTIRNKNGKFVADSREVAEMVGKEHAHLLRDIKGYIEILGKSNFGFSDFFIEETYTSPQNKKLPRYDLTRKGCDMVANKMTGEKGVLFTATYVTRFEEMEKQLAYPQIPKTLPDALRLAAEIEEQRVQLELKIEENKPKVIFAEALEASKDSILVAQLATILKQNGINIGQNRLFRQLREEGYLCKSGDRYNLPTQKSMNLGLIETQVRMVGGGEDIKRRETPKVTGKGQSYFINKYKKAGGFN